MLPGDDVRCFVLDDALLWSCWFYSTGFESTLKDCKQDWRYNWHIAEIYGKVLKMAGKSSNKGTQNGKTAYGAIDWINVNLTDADIRVLEDWIASSPDLLTEYVRLVGDGYSLGVKRSRDNKGFMATLIQDSELVGVGSKGLSAYAASPYGALACLLYKFVTVLAGEFPAASSQTGAGYR